MERADRVVASSEVDPERVVGRVRLDLEGRRKRRQVVPLTGGGELLVDLAAVPTLRDGDALVLAGGRLVRVEALPEPLMEVTAADEARLVEIAWHLGNRHLPVQFIGARLRLRRDHVIEAMLAGLGAEVRHVEAPFDPEAGAYGQHHQHGDHAHGDG